MCEVLMRKRSHETCGDPSRLQQGPRAMEVLAATAGVHETVARELRGPTLDIGCGQGRLASLLSEDVSWIGVDSSPTQLASNPHRPVVRADMRKLPYRDGMFAEVTHL